MNAILNISPDKLHSAIALSLKIGQNASCFEGKSIWYALRQQICARRKQMSELIDKVTQEFQCKSLLHLAARKGQVEHLQTLLDFDEDVDCQSPDKTRETPLMVAARYNEVDIVEFLVERGASLETQDDEGYTPMQHAVMGGKITNMLRLKELEADIFKESNSRFSAVHSASKNGHTEAVRILLEHGADVSKVYFSVGSPLTTAARNGHLEIVQMLLKNGGGLNKGGISGWISLHHVVAGGHLDVVECLLQKGGNILAKTNLEGKSVLHMATHLEMARLLVEQGADIHARGYDRSCTPLHVAAGLGQSDIVDYLLNQGADINKPNCYGKTALNYAFEAGHATTAKILIDRGCDFEVKNEGNCNRRLLESVTTQGFTGVVQLFLERGLSVDTVVRDGKTLLGVADEAGQCDMVTFLVDQGDKINDAHEEIKAAVESAEDSQRQAASPLFYALKEGHGKIAKLLIERGADTSNSSDKASSLAELALLHGLWDIF